MDIPAQLTVHASALARDGGSQTLYCSDENQRTRRIELHQSMFPARGTCREMIPGRLHLDGRPLEPRSVDEAKVIMLLRAASVRVDYRVVFPSRDPKQTERQSQATEESRKRAEEELRSTVARLVSWVESEEYVTLAQRVDRGDLPNGGLERGYRGGQS